MRKSILLLLFTATLGITTPVFSQQAKSFYNTPYATRNNGSFGQSTSILSFGYGFSDGEIDGYSYGNGSSGTRKVTIGPAYAKYEHGFLRDDVGLGGELALANTWIKYNYGTGDYKDQVTAFSLALIGYYHFNKLIPVKRLDVYVGTGLSIKTVVYSFDTDNSNNRNNHSDTNAHLVGKMGVRYYITPSFGVYAEGSSDNMSNANLGVSFRF